MSDRALIRIFRSYAVWKSPAVIPSVSKKHNLSIPPSRAVRDSFSLSDVLRDCLSFFFIYMLVAVT